MKLTIWDLFRFLLKGKWVIISITIITFLAAMFYVNRKQTYTANVIIKYEDSCISRGQTLKGTSFDVEEIISPDVMLRVIEDTGLSSQKMDSIRNKITITPIEDTAQIKLKEANQKNGIEYEYYPNAFCVSYDGSSSFEQTRSILNSVINNYFDYYANEYLYLASIKEVDYTLNSKDFDYIEQAELIEKNVKNTVSSLSSYSRDSNNYVSPSNGISFNMLINNFEQMDTYLIPQIFEKIYNGKITKNKPLLINKYTERKESYLRVKDNEEFLASKTKEKMDAYVEANLDVPNAYHESGSYTQDELGVIKDVDESFRVVIGRTSYDSLFRDYADSLTSAKTNLILAGNCDNVIGKFENDTVSQGGSEKVVEAMIKQCLEELRPIYAETFDVIEDYNSYLLPKHVTKLCDICYFPNLSYTVYGFISIVLGFGLSCVAVIAYEIYDMFRKTEKKKNAGL